MKQKLDPGPDLIEYWRERAERAEEAVRAVEWADGRCPWCHGGGILYPPNYEPRHAPNCQRQTVLKDAEP